MNTIQNKNTTKITFLLHCKQCGLASSIENIMMKLIKNNMICKIILSLILTANNFKIYDNLKLSKHTHYI